jgi:hypothetical protein
MCDLVSIMGVLGNCANVVVAIVALLALRSWWHQISGASQHELAKKLAGAIRHVAMARDATLAAITDIHSPADGTGLSDVVQQYRERMLASGIKDLSAAINELSLLEGQLAVLWPDSVFNIVEAIRSQSVKLLNHADAEAHGDLIRKIVSSAPDSDFAYSFTHGTFKRAMDDLVKLVNEWLQYHLGHETAKRMSDQEFSLHANSLKMELKERARSEKVALDQDNFEE